MRKVSNPRNPGEYIYVFTWLSAKDGNSVAYIMADTKDPRCKGLK